MAALRWGSLWVALASTLGLSGPAVAQTRDEAWTVQDSIRMLRLPGWLDLEFGAERFVRSGDGALVMFRTISSDLARDLNTTELRVYRAADLERFAQANTGQAPAPLARIERASRTSRAAIERPRFSADGRAVLFVGRSVDSPRGRMMVLDLNGNSVRTLPELPGEVSNFELLGDQQILVLSAAEPPTRQPSYKPQTATGRNLNELVSPRPYFVHFARPQRAHLLRWGVGGSDRPMELAGVFSTYGGLSPRISPDGRWIALWEVFDAAWQGRCWAPAEGLPPPAERGSAARERTRLVFVERSSGRIVRPLAGPSVYVARQVVPEGPAWRDDGTVIAPEHFRAEDECVRIAAGAQATATRWRVRLDGAGSAVPADPGDRGTMPTEPTPQSGPLVIDEGYNLPPSVVAVGPGGVRRALLDLAPHARGRSFGSVEEIQWLDSTGRPWSGVLALPPEHRAGQRWSLLLQTHSYTDPGAFFAEGVTTTAFPGRAALARGFAVLTLNERTAYPALSTAEEGRVLAEGYRSAINELDRRGLIDPKRVGVIGWSRTSFHVKHALAHAPELFAAAVASDGVDYGYWQLLGAVDGLGQTSGRDEDFNRVTGGPPWGRWDAWARTNAAAMADQVRTPLLAESASGGAALLAEWEFYAALRMNRVPSELVIFPEGEHSLTRPSERLFSTQGALDWLDFWIHRRSEVPGLDAERLRHWTRMREQWGARPSAATP